MTKTATHSVPETSKKDQASKIYKTGVRYDHTRAQIISKFVERLGMTKGMASTYYQNFHSAKWTV